MPIYEYCCQKCGHCFEVLQKMGEVGDSLTCPQCGAPKPAKKVTACSISHSSSSTGSCAANSGFS
ncbi:MAG: zinc ribbon domain-containing protein [Pseudomonadota bacterium]|nr:zinc ribbon domain-containing protein [Pseudomonadota bacterium]MEA3241666.1 zinc ribbon domain-containing protein [Pseudomonadota bacterium]